MWQLNQRCLRHELVSPHLSFLFIISRSIVAVTNWFRFLLLCFALQPQLKYCTIKKTVVENTETHGGITWRLCGCLV
jgi:hypothetical protein